jgi:hypothetical protein
VPPRAASANTSSCASSASSGIGLQLLDLDARRRARTAAPEGDAALEEVDREVGVALEQPELAQQVAGDTAA